MKLKPVCLLLSLGCAGSASAIGLGELNLHSFLGQPLHATVTVLGASPETSADCFSVARSEYGIAPPPRTQLSLQRSGEQALLHIRSEQPVNEPVAQFVLVSDCEARLQRDYTVLLDPPAEVEPAAVASAPAAAETAAETAPAAAPAPRASRPQRRVGAASAPPATRARQSAAPATRGTPTDAAPRLVLSGTRGAARPAGAPLNLQLDPTLPDPARPRAGTLTPTELSDEHTALARRLAHLEAQLVALQRRNAELEAQQRPAAAAAITPPPARTAQWPLYLLAAGLLGAGIALVAGLLRRNRPARSQSPFLDESPWTEPDPTLKTLSDRAGEADAEPRLEAERMAEIAAPPRAEGTEVKEDILDQAEVFMAHGHGDLAIHLLQEHLRDAPTESPVPWLLLLDLLHREGDTEGYAAASAECRRYFNVNLTGHPVSQDNEPSQGLEAYPHLLEQLVRVWNTPEIDAFFRDLIYDDRGGTRMGFEPGAYRDILLLRAIAQDALALAA